MEKMVDRTRNWVDMENLKLILGGREALVVAEIVAEANTKGVTILEWRSFRKRTGMAPSNLYPILKRMEERGLICRRMDREGNVFPYWGEVWVNPSVVLDPWVVRNRPELQAEREDAFHRRWEYAMACLKGMKPPEGAFIDSDPEEGDEDRS